MSVYVELFARSEPIFVHSEPATSRNPESVVIAKLRAAIANGSLSGTGLTMMVIEHIEPLCECDGPTIRGPCVILQEGTTT